MTTSTSAFRPVIESLLDTDLYKFTMWQAMLHRHPAAQAEYHFICRDRPQYPLAALAGQVQAQIDHLCGLRYTEDELRYLGSLRYIKSDFTDFLSLFHFQRRFIEVRADGDELVIVARGPQVHVMGFEIFVLAIVNELYFRRFDTPEVRAEGRRRLAAKLEILHGFAREPARRFPLQISDFGLRRRFARDWQDEVVATLVREAPRHFTGTSNVWLAHRHKLVPVGTMAHEYLQSYQAFGKVRLRDFQRAALEDWVQEYRGDLGIALTDVVGMDAFMRDFDLYFAKLFDNQESDIWTSNCECAVSWTSMGDKNEILGGDVIGFLRFSKNFLYIGGVNSGGQLACPREFASVGEPVSQPAGTAACGGRPQAEERVPVPLGARVARAGRLSTGGRVPRGAPIPDFFQARSTFKASQRVVLN